MKRIQLVDVDSAPMLAAAYFAEGDPGPIVAALANVPELLEPTLRFVGAALGTGSVSARCKELAVLRTSMLLGCRYCINARSAAALDVGLSPHEVRALRGEVPIEDAFAEAAERVLITWVDAMAGATGEVPDDLWERVGAHFADHALVELSVTIGATMFLNRFATGFRLPSAPSVLDRLSAEQLL